MSRRGARAAFIAAVFLALGAADAQAGSIAFVSNRCEPGEPPRFALVPGFCQQRLWRADEDGSGLRRLTDTTENEASAGEPAWSPDGARIAYTLGGGTVNLPAATQIWLMNADGTGRRPLTPGGPLPPSRWTPTGYYGEGTPTWSPTGLFLVFSVSVMGLSSDLYAVAADGSGYRRLTDTSEFESDPSFSPDGLSILYTRRDLGPKPPGEPREADGLYSLSLIDGRTRRVTLGPSPELVARYSPDGSRLSYLDGNAVWTMSANGRDRIRRTPARATFGPGSAKPAWAGPDSLIFAPTYRSPDDAQYGIQRLDVSGPGLAPAPRPTGLGLPEPPVEDKSPAWHPGTPILPLPPLPDLVAPELGLVDIGATPAARAAARAKPPKAASRRTLRYTAFDRSGIKRLQASIERKRGKRCRYLTRKGLGKRRSCRKPAYFEVRRRVDWTNRLPRLAPGTYRIRLRAWDARGNRVKYPRPKTVRIRR